MNDVPNTTEFDQYLGTTAGVPFQNQRWAQRQLPARQPYTSNGQSSLLYSTTGGAASESGHGHSASETTIEAKPTSPPHDSVKVDQVE